MERVASQPILNVATCAYPFLRINHVQKFNIVHQHVCSHLSWCSPHILVFPHLQFAILDPPWLWRHFLFQEFKLKIVHISSHFESMYTPPLSLIPAPFFLIGSALFVGTFLCSKRLEPSTCMYDSLYTYCTYNCSTDAQYIKKDETIWPSSLSLVMWICIEAKDGCTVSKVNTWKAFVLSGIISEKEGTFVLISLLTHPVINCANFVFFLSKFLRFPEMLFNCLRI